MTKQDQFLFIVQTAMLANAINLASDPESNQKCRHIFSATGSLGTMDDAVYASERIPDEMTAYDAAHQFCSFILENLRKAEESAQGKPTRVPHWFVRH